MNKNSLLLLGLGAVVLYFYEQSQKSSGTCPTGYSFVNGQCIQNPTTAPPVGTGSSSIPCAPGYVSYFDANGNQTCIQSPTTGVPDPISALLNEL